MLYRDYGLTVGTMPTGERNLITDVPGVTVGHRTISNERHNTGVTVVMPCPQNPFTHKLTGASFVLNGFGKTLGLVQIDELGTIETPIALTNTLNVGLVHDALVEYMIRRCKTEDVALRSVNPVVCECNDASLNDICERAVTREDVLAAIDDARVDFEQGAVGCGRGTTCHGLKGGVGSASRVFTLDGRAYALGVLVQTNHGRFDDLRVDGRPLKKEEAAMSEPDKGSCIVILATDAPLDDRQLRRVLKRCSVGLARLGSFIGHGSGEVFVGFSTGCAAPLDPLHDIVQRRVLNEERIDILFRAAAESTEEAVLNSMVAADDVTGWQGHVRRSIRHYL